MLPLQTSMVNLEASLPGSVRQSTHQLRTQQISLLQGRLLVLKSHLPHIIWPLMSISVPRDAEILGCDRRHGAHQLPTNQSESTEGEDQQDAVEQDKETNPPKAKSTKKPKCQTKEATEVNRSEVGLALWCVWGSPTLSFHPGHLCDPTPSRSQPAPLPISVARGTLKLPKRAQALSRTHVGMLCMKANIG